MSGTVAVVGAGIAGVAAAGALAARGWAVTLLDKSPRVGGRMATRRVEVPEFGPAAFDHGAPRLLSEQPPDLPGMTHWFGDGRESSYRAAGGMRSVVERLAAELPGTVEVRLAEPVLWVRYEAGGWVVGTDAARVTADWLLLTPPLPQTLDLLGGLVEELDPGLRAISYSPCLTLLAAGPGATHLPASGGVWLQGEPLWAVVDNRAKGVSAVGPAATIYAGPAASLAHWDEPEEAVAGRLLGWADEWVQFTGRPYTKVHRWRYSRPLGKWPQPCYADAHRRLVLAGDAFRGSGLYGAYRSGLAAAEAVA